MNATSVIGMEVRYVSNAAAYTARQFLAKQGPYHERVAKGLVKSPSPMIYFISTYSKSEDVQKAYPGIRSRLMMRAFKNLAPEDLKRLEEICRAGKKKYVQLHSLHKKWTPYQIFVIEQSKKEAIRRLAFRDRLRAIAKIWRNLGSSKRAAYGELATQVRKMKKVK